MQIVKNFEVEMLVATRYRHCPIIARRPEHGGDFDDDLGQFGQCRPYDWPMAGPIELISLQLVDRNLFHVRTPSDVHERLLQNFDRVSARARDSQEVVSRGATEALRQREWKAR